MKKIVKPGFEFIFSLSLIAILGLPPLVLAQNQKSIDIKIANGDTTINGKNIKQLSSAERKDALAAMADAPIPPPPPPAPGNQSTFLLKENKNGKDITIQRDVTVETNEPVAANGEKTEKRVRLKRLKTDSAFTYRFDNDLPPMDVKINTFRSNGAGHKPVTMNGRNSQSFVYSCTDGDGITTNVNYSVSDAPADKLKALTYTDKANLEISELNLNYEFSSANTILSVNLPAGLKELKLTSSNGNVVWADKTSATSFSKKFALPVNGVYYLQVKQGNRIVLKKIVKE
ncbi:T9SS type A sorting domain-containing protein [Mucilaginibacter sp. 21P]|uniref:T9SS type A sorting domain-containing protein n=1 Tax=Mucilaginibacter sp. 21P TaxID=2778902 RepID=UPI001C56A4B9|nr:T9SS type A sorting domain-containing protein [Mucilaginibacter sp. 21P]QXV65740.1 T9SS type A sorting domain-containing protein [Mucilaginibacter sp. 21P]